MSLMTNVVPIARASEADFDAFWKLYPRRVGKPLAKAKWDAITAGGLRTRTLDRDSGQYIEIELSATPEEILAGVRRYVEKNRKTGVGEFGFRDDGKYLLHPNTFLNQGRWMDD